MSDWINKEILKGLPLTDETILLICNHFGLESKIVNDLVFVKTPIGYWRIQVGDDKVEKVFHGNSHVRLGKCKKVQKIADSFHEQTIYDDDFYEVIKYIYYHDKYYYKNDKKSRIDILLEKI